MDHGGIGSGAVLFLQLAAYKEGYRSFIGDCRTFNCIDLSIAFADAADPRSSCMAYYKMEQNGGVEGFCYGVWSRHRFVFWQCLYRKYEPAGVCGEQAV